MSIIDALTIMAVCGWATVLIVSNDYISKALSVLQIFLVFTLRF